MVTAPACKDSDSRVRFFYCANMIRDTTEYLYTGGCALLGGAALLFTWLTGHRGVFLLDQSMIFDGGWRLLQGQVLYKDFLVPFGPVTFVIQALSFKVFGVNWSAM